jgi:hypothetical protein
MNLPPAVRPACERDGCRVGMFLWAGKHDYGGAQPRAIGVVLMSVHSCRVMMGDGGFTGALRNNIFQCHKPLGKAVHLQEAQLEPDRQ